MDMTGKVMTLNMTANGENTGQNVKKNVDMAKELYRPSNRIIIGDY